MGELIMELKNVTKYFPGVIALNDMSFQVRTGEVHGLIGENGAGKSTLIKVFTGVNQPEKGKIFIDGKEVKDSAYLRYELYQHQAGDTIKVTYIRDGKEHTVDVKLSASE